MPPHRFFPSYFICCICCYAIHFNPRGAIVRLTPRCRSGPMPEEQHVLSKGSLHSAPQSTNVTFSQVLRNIHPLILLLKTPINDHSFRPVVREPGTVDHLPPSNPILFSGRYFVLLARHLKRHIAAMVPMTIMSADACALLCSGST